VIDAFLTTTGGTGAFAGATGASRLTGTALFTFISTDNTFSSGVGDISISAVPEPNGAFALAGILGVVAAVRYRKIGQR
jgi:hypothetical protein